MRPSYYNIRFGLDSTTVLDSFDFKDICILAVTWTNNLDSWKRWCTKVGITPLKSVKLPAGMPAICTLDFKLELSAFAAAHLPIKKKKLSLIAISSAEETILRFAVVL